MTLTRWRRLTAEIRMSMVTATNHAQRMHFL